MTVEQQAANWHPDIRAKALELYAKALAKSPPVEVPKPKKKRVKPVTPHPVPLLRRREPNETGPWRIEIPGWCPPSLNRLLESHYMRRWRMKQQAHEVIANACLAADVPRADECRRVSILMTLPPGRRQQDEDNPAKVIRDGLVACGALVDDRRRWCVTGDYPEAEVGPLMTTIVLESMGNEGEGNDRDT